MYIKSSVSGMKNNSNTEELFPTLPIFTPFWSQTTLNNLAMESGFSLNYL